MTERPILFSGPMVRALLAGTKTQTRRIINPQPNDPSTFGISPVWGYGTHTAGEHKGHYCIHAAFNEGGRRVDRHLRCQYGAPGDRLWVKETFIDEGKRFGQTEIPFTYRADYPDEILGKGWTPSIFCTRKASRITLEVMSVRVERLNDITEADAKAEGATPSIVGVSLDHIRYRAGYATLWESINGVGSWDINPWVWVVEFRVLTQVSGFRSQVSE